MECLGYVGIGLEAYDEILEGFGSLKLAQSQGSGVSRL